MVKLTDVFRFPIDQMRSRTFQPGVEYELMKPEMAAAKKAGLLEKESGKGTSKAGAQSDTGKVENRE